MDTIRWGILGTGNIARQFARGLAALPDAELVAVGSRSAASAAAFADEFGAARRYASYEELAHDDGVDAVYISTPHPLHHDNTLLCLNAGRAVLCEKPFAINAAEARAMVAAARAKGLFLMEAMWTRFLPLHTQLWELLQAGAIGEVERLEADFGFYHPFDPAHRLFDPQLGGGALLDVGIYPLALASRVFGPPARIASSARLAPSGVDEVCAAMLGYTGGRSAHILAAIRAATPQQARIEGTAGQIDIHRPWWRGTRMTLRNGKGRRLIVAPFIGNGYNYEAAEVGRCLRAGLRESNVMPLDETITLMATLDRIRAAWGLRYPMERS